MFSVVVVVVVENHFQGAQQLVSKRKILTFINHLELGNGKRNRNNM